MATMNDVLEMKDKKRDVVNKKKPPRAFLIPDECLEYEKKDGTIVSLVNVVEDRGNYTISAINPWLRYKGRIVNVDFNTHSRLFGVFVKGSAVCLAGFFGHISDAQRVITDQSDADTVMALIKEAQALEEEGILDAALQIVESADDIQQGHSNAMRMIKDLDNKIRLKKARETADKVRKARSEGLAVVEEEMKNMDRGAEPKEPVDSRVPGHVVEESDEDPHEDFKPENIEG